MTSRVAGRRALDPGVEPHAANPRARANMRDGLIHEPIGAVRLLGPARGVERCEVRV